VTPPLQLSCVLNSTRFLVALACPACPDERRSANSKSVLLDSRRSPRQTSQRVGSFPGSHAIPISRFRSAPELSVLCAKLNRRRQLCGSN
jgi:hypothetical protein